MAGVVPRANWNNLSGNNVHDAALSDCIRTHGAPPVALQAYEALRLAPGRAVVQRARELGAYMQAQGLGAGHPDVRRDAEAVLRETAIDPSRSAAAADETVSVH